MAFISVLTLTLILLASHRAWLKLRIIGQQAYLERGVQWSSGRVQYGSGRPEEFGTSSYMNPLVEGGGGPG